jgi:hypothetical protein
MQGLGIHSLPRASGYCAVNKVSLYWRVLQGGHSLIVPTTVGNALLPTLHQAEIIYAIIALEGYIVVRGPRIGRQLFCC